MDEVYPLYPHYSQTYPQKLCTFMWLVLQLLLKLSPTLWIMMWIKDFTFYNYL